MSSDALHIRAHGSDGLLFKLAWSKTVYSYRRGQDVLTAHGLDVWDAERTAIVDCREQRSPLLFLRIDRRLLELRGRGNRVIPTAGNMPVKLTEAPSGLWVAVLSADGPGGRSVMPFLGQGSPRGPHYHQILARSVLDVPLPPGVTRRPYDVVDYDFVGTTARLPLASDGVPLNVCWTGDERHVVYWGTDATKIAVVTFDPEETSP